MAPRFDFDDLTLELAVADLLEQRLARSLGFANRGGYERLWLGQAIHSRYQEAAMEADPTYRREVHLVHTFQHRGWKIVLTGRIDGIRRDPDGRVVVEEIKSVRRGGQLAPPTRELYERQALLYAWMLHHVETAHVETAAEGGGEEGAGGAQESLRKPRRRGGASESSGDGREPPGVELVLIEIGGDGVERIPVMADWAALEAAVQRRLNSLIRTAEAARIAEMARRDAAAAMRFPYPDPRPGQGEIMDAVTTALEHREHLLLQAATGIGKTVSALFPALRYALGNGKRVFVLTAKTLQQDMAMKVLDLLNDSGAYHSLRLRAKAKMCANDQILCHEEYCPYARDYYLKLLSSGVTHKLLDEYPTLEPDAIFAASEEAEVCPFEVSLELSGRVEVTVCDYNYAFDPYVALTDFREDNSLSDTILVIDEIHNLVDRGRGYYSPALSADAARRAGEVVGRGGAPIHLRIAGLAERLARLIEETVEDGLDLAPTELRRREHAAEAPLPGDQLWALRPAFDSAFVDYLEYRRETMTFRAEDPFVELYFDLLRFLNGLFLSDSSFSHLVVRDGDDHLLKILCRDPSRFLGKVIGRCHSVIGLSATLSPPEFYRDLLGFEAGRTAAVAIANPFPPENRRVVIDPSIATTYRERPSYYDPIAESLGAFAESVPGNCLALFPSYAFLAEVASRMEPGTKRVLIQRRADTDRERQEILDHLRSSLYSDVLLMAVAGGVFAEGVDYPGDMLRGVAVVGPCLPALTLEQELLKEYYDERFERGFEYAFVVPGMTRVVQAAGRLIRSPEDTGVIALLDRRFLHKPYRDHLPPEWLPEEGFRALTGRPSRAADEFFGDPAPRRAS